MKHNLLKLLFFLIFSLFVLPSEAQDGSCSFSAEELANPVQVQTASIPDLCYSGDYQLLPDIKIMEPAGGERGINADDATTLAVLLELPDGLEFKRAANGVAVTPGGSITYGSKNVQSNAIFLFLSAASPTVQDAITISGIEVRNVSAPAGNYQIMISPAIGCMNGIPSPGTTVAAEITVLPPVEVPQLTINNGPNFCMGDVIPAGFTSVYSQNSLRYFADAALTSEITGSITSLSSPDPAQLGFTTSTAGKQSVYVLADSFGCRSQAVKIEIEVAANPLMDFSTINGNICPGEQVLIDLRDFINPDGNITWENFNPAIGLGSGGGDFIYFTAASNPGTSDIQAVVEVTAVVNGCEVKDQIHFNLKPGPQIGAFSPPVEMCNSSGEIDLSTDPRFGPSLEVINPGTGGTFTFSGKGITHSSGKFNASTNTWADNELVDIDVTYTRSDGCTTTRRLTLMKIVSNPSVEISSPMEGEEVCRLGKVQLNLNTNNQTTGITWKTSGSGTFSGTFNSSSLTQTYFYTPGSGDNGQVILTATTNNPGDPCTIDTDQVTLNFFEPVIAIQPDIFLCPGQSGSDIVFSSSRAGGVFNWSVADSTLLGLSSSKGTGNLSGIKAAANTSGVNKSTTVTVTQTVDGCTSAPMTFQVFVKPQPVVTTISNQTFCPDTPVKILLSSTPSDIGTVFEWYSSNSATGIGNGTGKEIIFTTTNDGATPISTIITYTATLNNCRSEVGSFEITVNPEPQVNIHPDIVVCSGQQVESKLGSSVDGATFRWIIEGPASYMPASGEGNINFTSLAHSGTADVERTVRVWAKKDGCEGNEQNFKIILKPRPEVVQKSDTVVFPGAGVPSISFSDNSGGAGTFGWRATNAEALGLSVKEGTGPIPAFTANGNTTGASIISVIKVGALWNGCQSVDSMEFRIELSPQPKIDPVKNVVACPGDAVRVDFKSDVEGATFEWENINKALTGSGESGTGPLSFTAAANTSGSSVEANMKVTPVSGDGLRGNPAYFTITVKSAPLVDQEEDIYLCPGTGSADVLFSSQMSGGVFNWSVADSTLLGLSSSKGTGNLSGIKAAANTSGVNKSTTVTVTQTVDGCTSAPMTFQVFVKPQPVVTTISNQAFCPGEEVKIFFTANTNESNTSYKWRSSSPLVESYDNGVDSISFIAPPNDGTGNIITTITYSAITDGCLGDEKSFEIHIRPTPEVIQPLDKEVCSGSLVRMDFDASLSGSTFTWTIADTVLGIPPSGTGSLNFPTKPHFGSENIVRTVKVKAIKDGCLGEEKEFQLILKPSPRLVQQNNLVVSPGQKIPEIVFADNSSEASTISWTASDAGIIGLPANNGYGSLPSFTARDNTGGTTITSRIFVDAVWNGCYASRMEFTISLLPRPEMAPESDIIVCPDTQVDLKFEADVPGSTFNWIISNKTTGLDSAGTGDTTFVAAKNFSGVPQISVVKVWPVSPDKVQGDSIEFRITVNPVPVVKTIPDFVVCPGESVSVDFMANTTGETFFWENDNQQTGLGQKGEGDFSFPAAENISGFNETSTITYYAKRGSCTSEKKTFTITLLNQPVPVALTTSDICSGEVFTPPVFEDDTQNKSTFYWSIDKPDLAGFSDSTGTGSLPVFRPAANLRGTAIPLHVQYFSVLNGCTSDTLTYKVNILPEPILLNEDIVVCAGETLNILLKANTGGAETFTWENSDTSIGLQDKGNGAAVSFTARNPEKSDKTAKITVNVSKNGCSFPGQTFNIVVKPLPAITNDPASLVQNLCSGEPVVFTPTANIDKVVYTWTATSDIALPGLKTSGKGPINETVLNNTSKKANITYTIQAVREDGISCSGGSVQLKVSLAPVPDLQLPQLQYEVCNGGELIISPSSTTSIAGTSYKWTVNSNISGGSSGSGSQIVQTLGNEQNTADTLLYTIQAFTADCRSVSQTVRVIVRPFVTVSAGEDITVCEEEPIVVQGVLGGSAAFGTWTGGKGMFQNPVAAVTTYHPDPSEVGTTFSVYFTTSDPAGPCGAKSDTVNITIEPLPEVTIRDLPAVYCTLNEPFLLEGFPSGGTFSGEGVVYNEVEKRYFFDPKVSGIGYKVKYSFQSSNGCTGIDERVVEVTSGIVPDFSILSSSDTLCETQGRIALVPQVENGVFEGAGVEIIGGSAWFNPSQAHIGENRVTYTISDQASGCTTSSSQTLYVSAKPEFSITYKNLCESNKVQFQADFTHISENDEVLSYEWSFNDGFSSDKKSPVREFGRAGVYSVNLRIETALSCEVVEVKQDVVVSNFQQPSFDFENICGNDTTLFFPAAASALLNFSDPEYVNLSYSWDFGDPASGQANTSSIASASHKFSTFGEYEVKLTISSSLGCEETVSQIINIVPAVSSFPYAQSFSGNKESTGWYSEGLQDSWQYGVPAGAVINHSAVAGTNVWATRLGGEVSYMNNERSYLISPCFDLKNIEQPMISMNLFTHTEAGRDGAVLQYSKDGGRNWITLGQPGEGLNWYNTTNIVADPANEGIGNVGWSGVESGWKEIAFKLDEIKQEESPVIFRITFASDGSNVGQLIYEGVALDDVYIGPRNKQVLVENFTNMHASGFAEQLKNFTALAEGGELAQDVVLLQYHTAFPLQDTINLRNPEDPGARALFYGIYEAPGIVIDGVPSENIERAVIERQALSQPGAQLRLKLDDMAGSSLLKGVVEVNSAGAAGKELILYINAVVVEEESSNITHRNVLRKILPEPGGIYLPGLNGSRSFEFNYEIAEDYAAGKLGVVAFLQEKESKKVLQSAFLPVAVAKKGGELTAVTDILQHLRKGRVFPNPVDEIIYLQTSQPVAKELSYEIVHLNGIVIRKGTLKAYEKEHQIASDYLQNGIYMLRVSVENSEPAIFKIMVLHQ